MWNKAIKFFKPDLKFWLAHENSWNRKSAPTILNAANEVVVESF